MATQSRWCGMVVSTIAAASPGAVAAGSGRVLHDNGLPDLSNGISNAVVEAFGARRTVLDDFEVPPGTAWIVSEIQWREVWNTMQNVGTGVEILFRADDDGSPGEPLGPFATALDYEEIPLGITTFFNRPVNQSWARFPPITLGPGRYWFEAAIIGPEDNFWMIRPKIHAEDLWVNYDDIGGLQRGSELFGESWDLNYKIFGLLPCTAVDRIGPDDFFVFAGLILDGTRMDLFKSDDERLVIGNRPPDTIDEPAVELEIWAVSPIAGGVIITLAVETASTARPAAVVQTIEMLDYAAGRWKEFDRRPTGEDDTLVEIVVNDGAERFFDPTTRRLRARVRWFDPGRLAGVDWQVLVDQAAWRLTSDCNANGVSDCDDIANGTSEDCNGNDVVDECESDCNGNGFADECDLAEGRSADCNENRVPDECDIAEGRSEDDNGNGIPDECEGIADLPGHGRAGFADLLDVLSRWGPCAACDEDVNRDQVVDLQDVLEILANRGPGGG